MRISFRRGLCALLCLFLCLPGGLTVLAAEDTGSAEAQNISSPKRITQNTGFGSCKALFDGDTIHSTTLMEGASFTVEYPEGLGSVYLLFQLEPTPYTITDNTSGATCTAGEHGFLHEFVDLEALFGAPPTSVTFSFASGAKLNELYLFTSGKTPDFVQKWQPPKEDQTDLILFSTHGDDEQLFFAGLLPYYAGELQYEVLVVYLTNHRNRDYIRCHEMLNGLWSVGVTTYPVFGPFGDYLTKSMRQAYDLQRAMGEPEDALLHYVVEQIRRYKPLVAVGHDLLHGEYGHGQHMMYADLLCRSLELSNDPQQFPELAQAYGVWEVPKTYLHLWPENPIVLDLDQPLERFDGLSAYQVTKQRGFPSHVSQIDAFAWYMAAKDRAADISKYSPCQYGLYRSTVGPDTGKQDLFENLTSYTQQAAQAAALALEEECRGMTEELRHCAAAFRNALEQVTARIPFPLT